MLDINSDFLVGTVLFIIGGIWLWDSYQNARVLDYTVEDFDNELSEFLKFKPKLLRLLFQSNPRILQMPSFVLPVILLLIGLFLLGTFFLKFKVL